ncbi:MAG TPA: penicillin-binding protein 2 [Candidatus Woesebacteria bacterium]|nr:penicillin-binding protein 2 [Candidatus Woesebacteria bacterium]
MPPLRIKSVKVTIVVCFFAIIFRMFYWQIIKFDTINLQATNQLIKPSIKTGQKGNIYFQDNSLLAGNELYYQLSLYKPEIKDLESLKTKFPNLDSFINNPKQKWITLKDHFDYNFYLNNQEKGFIWETKFTRFYPNQLAIPIINGLENYYQNFLAGKTKYTWEKKDALNRSLITNLQSKANSGQDLKVTLNKTIQSILEKSLKTGLTKYQADAVSAIILNPSNGEIIAMASFEATPSGITATNREHSYLFEPGSVFKPITIAIGLESKAIDLNYQCTQCSQPYQIGDNQISNWDNTFHPHANLKDTIKYSDNISMSEIIKLIGKDNFLQYFDKLEINQKSGIDLPGESRPIEKKYWSPIDLATASFGQGFALTQIQLIRTFNTLANNGYLVTPHLSTQIKTNNLPIFSSKTTESLKEILKYGVEEGAVAQFKSKNFEACGKSGTAQVALGGNYTNNQTMASYIGFFPCNQPKATMVVTVDNPKSSPWGSSTAAPIWFDLASIISNLI